MDEMSLLYLMGRHVCEAMVIVLRFLNEDWGIQQRVARLMLLAKSMT